MSAPDKFPLSKTYRDRAEECRTLAKMLRREEPRSKVLKVAEEYDQLAMQAAFYELLYADGLSIVPDLESHPGGGGPAPRIVRRDRPPVLIRASED
jgi:hypothetical protein